MRQFLLLSLAVALLGQSPNALRPVSQTRYSASTELFAEYRPFVAGQSNRVTAHLTHTGEKFKPFTGGKVRLTLTQAGRATSVVAEGPERAGVFRLPITPAGAGPAQLAIDVMTDQGTERFELEVVMVYATASDAQAQQQQSRDAGLISYAKEKSWETDFSTGEVKASGAVLIPNTAIHAEGARKFVYVQVMPELFEKRFIQTGNSNQGQTQVVNGLKAGERIILLGEPK